MINLPNIKQDNFLTASLYETLQDKLTSQANSGQAVVNVVNGAQFSVGQCLVLYNLEGAFETVTIQSKNVNALTMTANLTNTYPAGSVIGKYLGYIDTTNMLYSRKQIPDLGTGADGAFVSSGNATWSTEKNFTNITIQNGHTITISANVAIKCQGQCEIQSGGKISALGYGHAGGGGSASDNAPAYQGSSQLGAGGLSTAANGGGGGGGDAISVASTGGGGGGYGTAGANGVTSGSGTVGVGGGTYNDAQLSTFTDLFLKGSGGGGASGSGNTQKGNGGAGGGVVRIYCRTFICTSTGQIDCDGAPGTAQNGAGGGGGAGGTIFVLATVSASFGTALLHANGGAGAVTTGSGGNGGSGRIRIEAPSLTGTTSPTYASGYTNNFSGLSKYGFYFTKKVNTAEGISTANAYIKQKAVKTTITSTVNAGQAVVNVGSGGLFEAGDIIIVKEGDKVERKTVQSVATNAVTCTTNFAESFTAAGEVFRVDVRAYCSMVDDGANENQVAMTMKDIYFLNSDAYLQVTFSKTVRSIESDPAGKSFIGCALIKSKTTTGDTTDDSLAEVTFEYF